METGGPTAPVKNARPRKGSLVWFERLIVSSLRPDDPDFIRMNGK